MIDRFERFSLAITEISRYWHKIASDEMEQYGLKGPHAQCLLAMSHNPDGLTSGQLCSICDKDKAAISRTIAELEQEGLVERCMKGTVRYRARLKLTEQGEMAATQVERQVNQAVEKAGEGMSEAQRAVFYQVLGLIANNLQALCEDGLE